MTMVSNLGKTAELQDAPETVHHWSVVKPAVARFIISGTFTSEQAIRRANSWLIDNAFHEPSPTLPLDSPFLFVAKPLEPLEADHVDRISRLDGVDVRFIGTDYPADSERDEMIAETSVLMPLDQQPLIDMHHINPISGRYQPRAVETNDGWTIV